jgi:DNA-binding MarR family transcriptional regulator
MKTQPRPPAAEKSAAVSMPEIFQRIEALEKRLKQFQGQTLKAARLTPPQYFILSLLAEKDGQPFKDLAEALACTRATVTGIVDTMEKKGLVVRRPNPEDRRSLLLKLTDKGKSLLKATPGLEKTFGSCCCDVLPPEEARELSRLLKKLSDALPF